MTSVIMQMCDKWEFKVFSLSCIFLHISEICIVEMEKNKCQKQAWRNAAASEES